MEYREFKLSELFKKAEFNKLPYKTKELAGKHDDKYCLPATTCGTANQGRTVYVPRDGATIFSNTISMSANGDAAVYYQPDEFTVLQDSYALEFFGEKPSGEAQLYLVTCIKKAIGHLDWNKKPGWARVKDYTIKLPITDEGKPDYAYMQERIAELEQERIAELENYLMVTGLDDYELTEEDIKALSLSESNHFEDRNDQTNLLNGHIRYNSFKIGELFSVKSPTKRFNANAVKIYDVHVKGSHPYVVRTSKNNGQRGYIIQDEKYLSPARTFSFGQDTATIFFQTEEYFTGDKIKIMSLINKKIKLSDEIACFLMVQIQKAFKSFSWGQSSFNEKILQDTPIYLPVTSTGEPDYDYMERYIRAIEKLCIKNVVEYKDKVIAETKRLVA